MWRGVLLPLSCVACNALAGLDALDFDGAASSSGASASASASANSTATTSAESSTSGSGGSAAGYASVVLNDGPLSYWRLGERAGASLASDELGAHDADSLMVEFGAPGAIAGDADTAAYLAGSSLLLGDVLDLVADGAFS